MKKEIAFKYEVEPGTELPIEHIREYDIAAEWCAMRGLKAEEGDPLPMNMNARGALLYINADPEAFQHRVREFAYALEMKRIHEKYGEEAD